MKANLAQQRLAACPNQSSCCRPSPTPHPSLLSFILHSPPAPSRMLILQYLPSLLTSLLLIRRAWSTRRSLITVTMALFLIAGGFFLAISGKAGNVASSATLKPPKLVGQCFNPQTVASIGAASPISLALPQPTTNLSLLRQSWIAYRQRFIQADGRVIDREANDQSTSEGQAYAMLRAVLINDRGTFSRTFNWAETNLARRDAAGKRIDQLWSWKWGRSPEAGWSILDRNFASDGDIDAVTALILAARRWNCPEYLELARVKLWDLWNLSTVMLPSSKRYLLPGPAEAFWSQPNTVILNPSYFAPYAFRLFAQVDRAHPWMTLVDSSYQALEAASTVSNAGLPSDWIALDPSTETFRVLPASDSLQSVYSFDAYRVWWRVALDANWFQAPQATRYLQRSRYLQQLWQTQQRIPARLTLEGQPIVSYEATSQYAMLYSALRLTNSRMAQQIYQQKLAPKYRSGFWDSNSAYYTQNLVWFGLLPSAPPTTLLRPQARLGEQ